MPPAVSLGGFLRALVVAVFVNVAGWSFYHVGGFIALVPRHGLDPMRLWVGLTLSPLLPLALRRRPLVLGVLAAAALGVVAAGRARFDQPPALWEVRSSATRHRRERATAQPLNSDFRRCWQPPVGVAALAGTRALVSGANSGVGFARCDHPPFEISAREFDSASAR